MKTNLLLTLILIELLLIAPAKGQFSASREDSLLTLLENKNKAMGSLAVMEKGKPVYARAIGYASLSPEKVSSGIQTRYRIGSISKMFTSVMIFQLIEEKKLQLTTTLAEYFPSIPNSGKITIGNMLNHRSGIHNLTDEAAYLSYMTQPKTKKEIIDIISAFSSDFEPGSMFRYSNSNYILLGYIVEQLRKDTYVIALQKYICRKIGLKDTHYGTKADPSQNGSYSFRYTAGWDRLPETDMSIPHGAGAIVSTPSDLVKFISALFDGKLVSMESFEKMKTITEGMGFGIQQFPYEDKKVYGHGGGIDGFNSILVYLPDDRLAVAYCSNGTVYSVNDILLWTLNNFYGKNDKLPDFRVYAVDPADLEKYKGVYSNPKIPIKLTITVTNGRLMGQGTNQPPFPLEGSAKDEFKFETAGITIRFRPDKNELDLKQGGAWTTFTRE
jgi:CubicO group peptidase (beta-lactamase class C family)